MKENDNIILFDGVCNLCCGIVKFVIKRDSDAIFRFASHQGMQGQELLKRFDLPEDDLDSFVLIKNDLVFLKATASLEVFKSIGWPWKVFYVFILIPEPLRNGIYGFIAKKRYRWFGRKESCMIPSAEIMDRFLD
ncbi:MAG: thiol-disulfide oxidoreductase DCC family protein [Bacteroidales bacterium]|nr:thiol-disulfide oxidoreductase DCC family protein [Bacteroidales bacterium]